MSVTAELSRQSRSMQAELTDKVTRLRAGGRGVGRVNQEFGMTEFLECGGLRRSG